LQRATHATHATHATQCNEFAPALKGPPLGSPTCLSGSLRTSCLAGVAVTVPPLSLVLPSLRRPFADGLALAAAAGFTHVDLGGLADRPAEHRELLAETGLIVNAVWLTGTDGLAAGDLSARRAALGEAERQVADAAQLGATCAVLEPRADLSGPELDAFADATDLLAAAAARRFLQLAVCPCPALTERLTGQSNLVPLVELERAGSFPSRLLLSLTHWPRSDWTLLARLPEGHHLPVSLAWDQKNDPTEAVLRDVLAQFARQ
jgi:hypothetical protein